LAPRRRHRIWRRNSNSSPLPYTNWCAKDAFKGWAPLGKSCFRVSAKHRNSAEFEPTCALFADVFLRAPDDEEAAQMSNKGRSAGVASTAMLICAVALEQGGQIFATDRDFNHYARAIPIQLFSVA
jgi:hypothetical protein